MIIIFFIVGMIGLIFIASWYLRFMVGYMVDNKHAIMEYIAQTGKVPEVWANKDYIKKLDKLILYIKTTSLINDESTRTDLLLRLSEVRNQWLEGKSGEELYEEDASNHELRP